MGFSGRLKKVKDRNAPIPERVMALCDALTHCHVGYARGKVEIQERFGWEIGRPISNELLMEMAAYLDEQWKRKRRSGDG